MLTLENLTALTGPQRAKTFLDPLTHAMFLYGIAGAEAEIFLAQILHESVNLLYTSELASGEAYDNRSDLGNTQPEAIAIAKKYGSTPGKWWKGHGLIQTTGYYNHLTTGKRLSLDLLNHPELLCQPANAAISAGDFWVKENCQTAARANPSLMGFQHITKIINGGLNGEANREAIWNKIKEMKIFE